MLTTGFGLSFRKLSRDRGPHHRKKLLGEVDVFQFDATHELYAT